MELRSESDLTDHVQLCMYCGTGITFMPSTVTWWAVSVPKALRDRDSVSQRVWCADSPDVGRTHRPDIDAAAHAEQRRRSIKASGLAEPLPFVPQ